MLQAIPYRHSGLFLIVGILIAGTLSYLCGLRGFVLVFTAFIGSIALLLAEGAISGLSRKPYLMQAQPRERVRPMRDRPLSLTDRK